MRVCTFRAVTVVTAALLSAGCSTGEETNADTGSGGSAGAGGNSNVGGGSDGGSAGSGFDECAVDSYDGELVPLDMMILMDRSGSMEDKVAAGSAIDRWSATTGALRDFIKAPMGGEVGVGVQFFPIPYEGPMPVPLMSGGCELQSDDCGPYSNCQELLPGNPPTTMCSVITNMPQSTCAPQDYIEPAVPIVALPAGVDEVESAIALELPAGGTPMTPAFQGAMSYLINHATANPERLHVMVLASDGEPAGCGAGNKAEAVGEIAKRGLENTPEIKTFVIGIGILSKLNLIAYQGGTDEAILVEGDNTGDEFLNRLNEIRNGLVACNYTIPVPTSGVPNFDEVNFKYAPEDSDGEWLPRVDSEAACGDEPGWYYDNPAEPTRMIMCSASCEQIKADGGTVEIGIGCETIIR
jgi:hypothetical protein